MQTHFDEQVKSTNQDVFMQSHEQIGMKSMEQKKMNNECSSPYMKV